MAVLVRLVFSGVLGAIYGFLPGFWKVSFLFVFPLMKNQLSRNIAVYSLCFYAVSMIPVALMSFGYSGEILFSLLVFAFVVALSSLLLTFCFSSEDRVLFLCLKVVVFFLVFLLPPFSTFSFSSPLWLSGLIFPGLGLLGVFLFILLVFGLRYKPFTGLAALSGMLMFAPTFAESPKDAVAVSTSVNQQQENSPGTIYASRIKVLETSKEHGASVVYYPESHFGVWHNGSGVGDFFKDSNVVIIGGLKRYVDGRDIDGARRYRYVIADLTNNILLYVQKISPNMFNPYVAEDAGKNQASEGVNVLGENVGFLVCWESLNAPVLINNLMSRPRYVVLFANTYWSKYYNAGDSLSYHFKAWARLFGVPSLVAINTAPDV